MGVKLDLLQWGEKHMLRLFDNRMLRLLGPKRDGVGEGCKRLHDEDFYDLYC